MSPDALPVADYDVATDNEPGHKSLPPGWAWAKLGEVGTWGSGGTPASNNPDYYDGNIPWYRITDLNGGRLPLPEKTISELGLSLSSAKLVEPPFLLLAMYGSIGKTGISTIRATTNQAIAWCQPHYDIDLDFVHFYLPYIKKSLVDQGQGGTQPNISRSILLDQSIPLAPAAEQRRIVARIDELFAEITEGEAVLERARQGLDTWRRALLKAAVTGELTRDWREAHPPTETGADLLARIRAEREASASRFGRGRRVTTPNCLEPNSLPALPEGWAWTTLGELSSLITSGSRGWKRYYAANGSVFIRAQNLKTDRLELDDVAYVELPPATEGLRTRVSLDDILITITGANVTRSAQVDLEVAEAYVNQHVGLVRLVDPRLSDFVFLVVVCPNHGRKQLKAAAYGAGKPGLNLNDLASVLIPLPSLEEQRLITTRVREAFSEAENALAIMDRGRPQADTLRESILKAAFEGRLVLQDPADEPASALLARLRNGPPGNGARRRRARAAADFFHPSLPNLTRKSVDPRVEPAGDG